MVLAALPLSRRTVLRTLGAGVVTATATSADAATEWTLFSSQPRSDPAPLATIKRMSDEMPARSSGALSISVRMAGSLPIRSTAVTAAVADGRVQLGEDIYYVSTLPAAGALRLPGLIVNDDHLRIAQPIQRAFLDTLFAKHKAQLIGYYMTPPQVIFTVRPVAGIDDLRGMVIRTTTQDQAEAVHRMGALAITMVTDDVLAALESGTLHGVFGTAVGAGLVWAGRLRFGCRITPVRSDGVILVNRAAMAALAKPVSQVITNFGADLAAALTIALAADEAGAFSELTGGGFMMAQPRPDDLIASARRLTPYWEAISLARGKEASDNLAALRLALGR